MKKLLLAIMLVIAGFGLVACDITQETPKEDDDIVEVIPGEDDNKEETPGEEDKEPVIDEEDKEPVIDEDDNKEETPGEDDNKEEETPKEEEKPEEKPEEPENPTENETTVIFDNIEDRNEIFTFFDNNLDGFELLTISFYKKTQTTDASGNPTDYDQPLDLNNLLINNEEINIKKIDGVENGAGKLNNGEYQIGDFTIIGKRITTYNSNIRIKSLHEDIGSITFKLDNINEISFNLFFTTDSSFYNADKIIIIKK